MAIFMQVDGVKGGVDEAGHDGWIEVVGLSWHVDRDVRSPKNTAADRESGDVSVSEVSITKPLDNATTGLMRLAMWGKGKKVTIDVTRTGTADKQTPYLQYELENVLFSGFSVNCNGGERPTENLSLSFTEIKVNNMESTANHDEGSPDRLSFNMSTGAHS